MSQFLVEPPANTTSQTYQQLGYVAAYDAVLNCDYAFVAYRETDSDGTWRVRIRSSQTAGAVFEPAAMTSRARATGARWGRMMGLSAIADGTSTRQARFGVGGGGAMDNKAGAAPIMQIGQGSASPCVR